jgi:hypothetical protein
LSAPLTPYTLSRTTHSLHPEPHHSVLTPWTAPLTPYTLSRTIRSIHPEPHHSLLTPSAAPLTPYTLSRTTHSLHHEPHHSLLTPSAAPLTLYTLNHTTHSLHPEPRHSLLTPRAAPLTPYTMSRTTHSLHPEPHHSLLTPWACVLLFTSYQWWNSSLLERQQHLIWSLMRPHPSEINNQVARHASLQFVICHCLQRRLLLNLKLKLNYKITSKHFAALFALQTLKGFTKLLCYKLWCSLWLRYVGLTPWSAHLPSPSFAACWVQWKLLSPCLHAFTVTYKEMPHITLLN